MHVFHIRGITGLLCVIVVVLTVLSLLTVVPATFMMIAWNAVIFEWFHGPQVDLHQGFLLWGLTIISLKLCLQPEFRIEYKCMAAKKADSKPSAELDTAKISDEAPPLDSQAGE